MVNSTLDTCALACFLHISNEHTEWKNITSAYCEIRYDLVQHWMSDGEPFLIVLTAFTINSERTCLLLVNSHHLFFFVRFWILRFFRDKVNFIFFAVSVKRLPKWMEMGFVQNIYTIKVIICNVKKRTCIDLYERTQRCSFLVLICVRTVSQGLILSDLRESLSHFDLYCTTSITTRACRCIKRQTWAGSLLVM